MADAAEDFVVAFEMEVAVLGVAVVDSCSHQMRMGVLIWALGAELIEYIKEIISGCLQIFKLM